jgi:5-methylcytosine-specific restriction endonuclease McrA
MLQASLQTLPDDELITHVQRLTARANVALADLLAHLGEVERRGIHREHACASLCTFCMYELRMSEDAAYRRSKAARLVREHPELRDLVAKGELHLTGLLMIGPYLGGERHAELLERARFRSKREIARLIAAIDPKPAVPSIVEPLGPEPGRATHQAYCESLAGPVRELPPGQRPEDWMEEDVGLAGSDRIEPAAEEPEPKPASSPLPEPGRPLCYKVQFTATQKYVDLMNEAFDLLGHELRKPDLVELELRAMREFVRQLRKRRRADSAPARKSEGAAQKTRVEIKRRPGGSRRRIPASVVRSVWVRDEGRCAYADRRGHRCRETRGLELHHRHAHALGGPSTVLNLELRCKAHNSLAAEQDFGRRHMDRVRGVNHAGALDST